MRFQQFFNSTRVIMGPGCLQQLPMELEKIHAENIVIITDPGLVKAGVVEKITNQLKGFNYYVYDGVIPNPSVASVDDAYHQVKKEHADIVLGIGGGSSIDTAKAVAMLLENGGSIADYIGREKYQYTPKPLFIIPTTVGTGSEATRAAIVEHENTKKIVGGASMVCRVAFLDGQLINTLPSSIIAATGMDALTHAIEGYVSNNATPITDALHLHTVKMIGEYLRPAVANSENIDAMQNMLIASTTTGIGFTNSLLGMVHSIAHVLGGHFGAPHGVLNAIMLPPVMEYNWIANPKRFADIANAFGINTHHMSHQEAALAGINYVRQLSQDIGIPSKLSDVGIKDVDLDVVTDEVYEEGFIPCNPRKPTKEDIRKIIVSCL